MENAGGKYIKAHRRRFVYTRRWRPNALVMWDNRCTMHAAPITTICEGCRSESLVAGSVPA
jgi:hypothetical protein